MTQYNKEDYINYRLIKAKESLESAKYLTKGKFWNASINRLYYSCFYVINALLLKNDISAKTHRGVRSAFGENFIRKNIISQESGRTFNKLFEMRNRGDYNDLFEFDEKSVVELFKPVEKLINEVNNLLSD
ncbi:MAG: HEPN domain-containing protein [Bacteroidetes bacterium]|nr:HEPN domain-containing protein [Bacteroidota bacterium]MBL7104808.1 HEPN domain-containing protein [Bacteroidales bacterium]